MSQRPNILLITTDQQRFDTIGAAGNPHIYTPHLNWLCDTGIRFSNAYATCPVCAASRATIMTGQHELHPGMTGNTVSARPIRSDYSVAGLLTQAGYQTRAQGKMDFRPNRCNYGFEQMEILEDYYRHMAAHPEKGVPMNHGLGQNEMSPTISTVDESSSLTHWTVDRSIDFLETRDPTRPFFLWTSFSKPHPPFDPCRNYWELYRNSSMPEPVRGDWSQHAQDVPEAWRRPSLILNMAWRYSAEQLRDIRRAYYACITQIDYNLGLLLARMRELELLDNTLILFTSDHGEMLGDHHLGAKSIPLEGSAHIPMLLRLPKAMPQRRPGAVCSELVCLADLLPTCVRFAGAKVPAEAEVDGIDLLAIADGRTCRAVLFGSNDSFHWVRQGSFKYMFESRGGSEMLFDLDQDPYEQHELVRAGMHVAMRQELRAKLTGRLQEAGHHAVKNGQLQVQADLATQPVPINDWPGFHSRQLPNDVAH